MRVKDEFRKSTINPKKYNDSCYIVGGGPSLSGFDWSLLNNKFVIAINRAYEVLPNAKIIYFTDPDFWEKHKVGMRAHGGYMMRGGLMVDHWHLHCTEGRSFWGEMTNQNPNWVNAVKESIIDATDVYQWHLSGFEGFDEKYGYLRHGKNSAYAALNMAISQFRFKKVYLLGLDMGWKEKGNKEAGTHWHDGHDRIDPESIYQMMRLAYTSCIPWIKKYKAKVINVNPNNTLSMFKHMQIKEVFKNASNN